jgi:hypothetical protein
MILLGRALGQMRGLTGEVIGLRDLKGIAWLAVMIALAAACSAAPEATREPTRRPTARPAPTLVPTVTTAFTATTQPTSTSAPPTASATAAPTATATATALPAPSDTPSAVPTVEPPTPVAATATMAPTAIACLSADEAGQHVGEVACVEFTAARTHNSGKAVFLNSANPYQGHFYAVIFPERWDCWPQAPEDYLSGRLLRARGTIKSYDGAPEIIIEQCEQLQAVP